jgi:hypothetical protein
MHEWAHAEITERDVISSRLRSPTQHLLGAARPPASRRRALINLRVLLRYCLVIVSATGMHSLWRSDSRASKTPYEERLDVDVCVYRYFNGCDSLGTDGASSRNPTPNLIFQIQINSLCSHPPFTSAGTTAICPNVQICSAFNVSARVLFGVGVQRRF